MNSYFKLMAFVALTWMGSLLEEFDFSTCGTLQIPQERELEQRMSMCARSLSCLVKIGGDTSECEAGNPQSLHEPSASSLDCEAVQQLLT